MLIVQVIETLSTSSHIEPWAARAAGLVFAQYFWFRHCFLLTTQQGEAVQQLVVSMLSDKKLEVQDLAAASLSGGLLIILLHFWLWVLGWSKTMSTSKTLITVNDNTDQPLDHDRAHSFQPCHYPEP